MLLQAQTEKLRADCFPDAIALQIIDKIMVIMLSMHLSMRAILASLLHRAHWHRPTEAFCPKRDLDSDLDSPINHVVGGTVQTFIFSMACSLQMFIFPSSCSSHTQICTLHVAEVASLLHPRMLNCPLARFCKRCSKGAARSILQVSSDPFCWQDQLQAVHAMQSIYRTGLMYAPQSEGSMCPMTSGPPISARFCIYFAEQRFKI